MILDLFVILEIIMIAIFFTAFFTKQEILWAISLVLSGALMLNSYNVEYYVYLFNSSVNAYYPQMISFNYPYLMAINLIFSALSLILGMFDLFDKYGSRFSKKNE